MSDDDSLLLPGKTPSATSTPRMYHTSSSMEAFTSLEESSHQESSFEDRSFSGSVDVDASDVFRNEIPLADIFTELVHDIKEADPGNQKESVIEVPPLSLPRLSSRNSPQLLHNLSPVSTFSEDSTKSRTLAGILKDLIHSKLSFKFSTPEPSIPHKETDINLSPTTVLHCHTESSSPTLNSILPFPASFPAVKSPMEALILANSFSFSMSHAVPESPEVHAVSPLSFDAGSPCEHLLPGRYGFYGSANNGELRATSVPQRLEAGSRTSMWRKRSISFHSCGDVSPKNSDSDVKVSENPAASRSSSKGSNTTSTTTASSEFSIDLSGKPAAATVEMNSSRYLELNLNNEEVNRFVVPVCKVGLG